MRFATGGGPLPRGLEALCKERRGATASSSEDVPVGDVYIGKQDSRGRVFTWRHGEKSYLVTDHRKCEVWCPLEHRWYAKRVQNNVPIFALEPQRKT